MNKFEVGDKVYLRDWDDMESQYGSFEIGGRVFLHTLCIEMDKILPICGRSWHVKEVLTNHSPAFNYTNYILTDGSDYIIPEEALIDRNWRPDVKEAENETGN